MIRPVMRPFSKGVAFTLCTISLVQDYIGKAAYLVWVRDYWIEWYYSVPIALLLLAFVVWADDDYADTETAT